MPTLWFIDRSDAPSTDQTTEENRERVTARRVVLL
jgi:hypothetical protein